MGRNRFDSSSSRNMGFLSALCLYLLAASDVVSAAAADATLANSQTSKIESPNNLNREQKGREASSYGWKVNQGQVQGGRIIKPRFLMTAPTPAKGNRPSTKSPGSGGMSKGSSKGSSSMSMSAPSKGKGVGTPAPITTDPPSKGKGGASKKGTSMSTKSSKSSKKSVKPSKPPTPDDTPAPSFSVMPTQAPATAAPNTPAPSASPTVNNFPTVLLQTYEVLYTIEQSRFLFPSEYEEVTNLTVTYLNDEFFDAFVTAPLVNLRTVETERIDQDFSFGDPVVIVYQTTLTFTQDSLVPEESELNQILADSFLPPNDEVYRLFLVDSLLECCDTNLFTTTSVIGFQFVTAASERDSDAAGAGSDGVFGTSGDDNIMIFAFAGAGAGLVAFLMVLLGLSAYDRRKEQRGQLLEGGALYEKGDGQTVGGETEAETTVAGDISSSWDSVSSPRRSAKKTHQRPPSKVMKQGGALRAPSPSSSDMSPLHHNDEDDSQDPQATHRQQLEGDDDSFVDEPLDDKPAVKDPPARAQTTRQ
uniref:SEA domain-containing protein n=1 Tax=Entomoneis paludosa TaxID=265537 RepID=A0A7S2V910_9STRA|mmetsp:Transcript_10134/g.20938  ORF Transcript_10134/g.20938 Transcript_10134/m.20938 type:complete len:532 (+) Transcript_10134:148-1743(+)